MSQRFLPRRASVSLRSLLPTASFVGCADLRVSDATESSQQCGPHMLFAAIPGTQADGTAFIDEAVNRGATGLLVRHPLPSVRVPQCIVPNVRKAYAELCAALYGFPSRSLKIAAVTGTNGKTTVTWLIRSILETSGRRTGLLGTIENHDGVNSSAAQVTTPDAKTFATWLAAMVSRGTEHAAVEVSSEALDQDRVAGMQCDVAIVTNITQDHFDYHKDSDSYRAAKARLLEHLKPRGRVVLNVDDPQSAALADRVPDAARLVTYGIERPADAWATILHESFQGTRFVLHRSAESIEVTTSLIGRHNVSNCLAAAAACEQFGVTLGEIKAGIEALRIVPGRLERIDCGQPFDVFVDYAQTEDALRRAIESLKRLGRKRAICVVGSGGDRDRAQRPLLGLAASGADVAIITSGNSRSEDPLQIIRDIVSGFDPEGLEPVVEPDRREAIRRAVESAEVGDAILIAGKGHEREQIVGNKRVPFADRDVVRELLVRHRQSAYTAGVGA